MKKIITLFLILSVTVGLFAGCGCSNKEIDEKAVKTEKNSIQKILNKVKIPLIVKRDEKGFVLTQNQTAILLRNRDKSKYKNTTLILYYLKWSENEEKDKDEKIRKLINESQESTKKAPKFPKNKIKKINNKAMFVQYGKVKKGKFKGWYGSQISFQDESNKNKKELLNVHYLSKNKKAPKQTIKFIKNFLSFKNTKKIKTSTDEFGLGAIKKK